jgi:hypothetical protein
VGVLLLLLLLLLLMLGTSSAANRKEATAIRDVKRSEVLLFSCHCHEVKVIP